jgi:hypothetical protein
MLPLMLLFLPAVAAVSSVDAALDAPVSLCCGCCFFGRCCPCCSCSFLLWLLFLFCPELTLLLLLLFLFPPAAPAAASALDASEQHWLGSSCWSGVLPGCPGIWQEAAVGVWGWWVSDDSSRVWKLCQVWQQRHHGGYQ